MSLTNRITLSIKALQELGIPQIALYTYYQFGLRSGLFRRYTPAQEPAGLMNTKTLEISNGLVRIPHRVTLVEVIGENASSLLAEANEIDKGKFRFFGGPPQDFNFLVPLPLEHWTKIALDHEKSGVEDIKYLWEPARFTWAYILARAYMLSEDDNFAEIFWREFEAFVDINLPNLGPNWVSSQEVAFRLIALVFAFQVFHKSKASSMERIERLGLTIAHHATRIPPTLVYARAQNNNHLLGEAAGLITAGLSIADHPKAKQWQDLGWYWFNRALQTQISTSGTYIQHSTNYHRLMLQIALWVFNLRPEFPRETLDRLAIATRWLSTMLDPQTGRVPNLGHNDGTYLQPLTSCSYHDYRPVVQAASLAFLGETLYPAGPWDELPLWLGISDQDDFSPGDSNDRQPLLELHSVPESHVLVRNPAVQSWALLRTARFHARPAHADQLHLDLWWRGLNIAQDAGTYLYNASPPWDNSFARTGVHNTLIIDNLEQMTPAGRFLWLNWAQVDVLEEKLAEDARSINLVAEHDAYRHLGLIHRRSVSIELSGTWVIHDQIVHQGIGKMRNPGGNTSSNQRSKNAYRVRLHWLLPDWSWELGENETPDQRSLRIRSPHGWIGLQVEVRTGNTDHQAELPFIQLVRAGESLLDSSSVPLTSGWVSPTYGYKIPALSFSVEFVSQLPMAFESRWDFPADS